MMAENGHQKPSEIKALAEKIQKYADELDEFYRESNLPLPSIDAESERTPLPPALLPASHGILEAMAKLEPLVMNPYDYITRRTGPEHSMFLVFQTIYRLRIASHLSVGEVISFDELAQRCDSRLKGSDLSHVLRLAISWYIFEEPKKGYIRHTLFSKSLQQSQYHEWIGFMSEEVWPGFFNAFDTMMKFPGSEELDEAPIARARGKPFYKSFDDAQAQRFADAMALLFSWPPFGLEHLSNDLEWTQETAPRLLVDVGGSQGLVAKHLAKKFPAMRIVVQDQAEVLKPLDSIQKDGRLQFQVHDLFQDQQFLDVDVFLIRRVLHNWSDKYASQIIGHLVPGLKPGSRVIVHEQCLQEPLNENAPNFVAQRLRGMDLAMKTCFNAKERDEECWKKVFQAANSRFTLERVKTSPGSAFSVIEFLFN